MAEKVSVSQALKHIVRDWSDEGVGERGDAFPCLLKTLEGLFPERSNEKPVTLLLPGAGLGRLGHELSGLGGKLQDPEPSYRSGNVWHNLVSGANPYLGIQASRSPATSGPCT